MAASEIVQELIRAHVAGDEERFRTLALQLAASEARLGHRKVAGKIRDLLETELGEPVSKRNIPTPISRPPVDLRAFLSTDYPEQTLRDVVLSGSTEHAIKRVLHEQRSRDELEAFGLTPRRKLLFYGRPGCGKTLTAQVLAHELGLPLIRVRVETLFSRYLGETANLLTEIFDEIQRRRAVFLFDEFDAVGRKRSEAYDVGEAKRVVSAFLQLLDADASESLIVAATNEHGHLDPALFRRFDDVVEFPLPDSEQLLELLRLRTSGQRLPDAQLAEFAVRCRGLSFADVARSVDDAKKAAVLEGRKRIAWADLEQTVEEALGRNPESE